MPECRNCICSCCSSILSQLPSCNHSLLCYFLCVLHHISRRSAHNLMSAANLGVCVGPSLLWADGCDVDDLRAVPTLVECLITHCQVLCGTQVPHLLGDPRDSGTEESDCKSYAFLCDNYMAVLFSKIVHFS